MAREQRTLEPRSAVVIEHRGPYYLIGEKFGALEAFRASHPANYGPAFALFYSDTRTTPEEELRSVAGLFVDGAMPALEEPFAALEVAGGEYAVTTHRGSYEDLPRTWQTFMEEPLPPGYVHSGEPPFEVYVSMSEGDDGAGSITELFAPVQRA